MESYLNNNMGLLCVEYTGEVFFCRQCHIFPPYVCVTVILPSAQAFHGAFEDFVTWLRETERKIQRDDPLKLEEGELKSGLKYLKVTMTLV